MPSLPHLISLMWSDLICPTACFALSKTGWMWLNSYIVRERGTKCVIYWFLQGSITFL